jgi:putative nicotinate phosphoribosyltransferase
MADQRATFELWVRRLPRCRNYLVAAGLEQAIHYLRNLSFAPEQVKYLRRQPMFQRVPASWFDRLASLRFEGDLWAVPEGTVIFAGEPLLRVTAPLMVAQIVETYLLTTMTMQTVIASKVTRMVTAARGHAIIDFGSRAAGGASGRASGNGRRMRGDQQHGGGAPARGARHRDAGAFVGHGRGERGRGVSEVRPGIPRGCHHAH